uniref:Protein N-terminal glutamine amidohydrolase n=1 Tax=Oncorhynchus mykiss TaxID=8022 RepID=A0A8C7NPS7_ONCMY
MHTEHVSLKYASITPFGDECENVWKLCVHIKIQNTFGRCDYHVILLHQNQQEQSFIYDLDTVLPFSCYFHIYTKEAFQTDQAQELFIVTFMKLFSMASSHTQAKDHHAQCQTSAGVV